MDYLISGILLIVIIGTLVRIKQMERRRQKP